MFNNLKYIKVAIFMIEKNLFKLQGKMLGSELLGMRLVNIEESYKPPQHPSSEITFKKK